jgi:hypothetical protein
MRGRARGGGGGPIRRGDGASTMAAAQRGAGTARGRRRLPPAQGRREDGGGGPARHRDGARMAAAARTWWPILSRSSRSSGGAGGHIPCRRAWRPMQPPWASPVHRHGSPLQVSPLSLDFLLPNEPIWSRFVLYFCFSIPSSD